MKTCTRCKTSTATKIVDAILRDLTDRRGLRQEWDGIDEVTQGEIKKKWISIVKRRLK